MNRLSCIACLTAAAALLGGCGTPAPRTSPGQNGTPVAIRLADVRWLLGTWRGSGEGENFYEAYRPVDDSTFSIVYFTDSTRTATQPTTGTVEQRGGRLYHTYGRSRWVADGSPTSLQFEPVERATNHFRWSYDSPSRWRATLLHRDSLGGVVTRSYTLERLAP